MSKVISKLLVVLTLVSVFQACTSLPKHKADEAPQAHEEHSPNKRLQPLGSEKRK